MKLYNILSTRNLLEGSMSDALQQTRQQRINSLSFPAELMGVNPAALNDELDKVLLRYNINEYVPDSFWDRLAKLCGTSINSTELFRKSFDKAKTIRSSKLRYLQGVKDSYDLALNSLDFTANSERLKDVIDLVKYNILFFDTFIYLLDSYVPGLDR